MSGSKPLIRKGSGCSQLETVLEEKGRWWCFKDPRVPYYMISSVWFGSSTKEIVSHWKVLGTQSPVL